MSGHGYRSSPNMSIKSNVTLNSFYNINSASTVLKPFQSSLPYRVIEALSSSSRSLQNLTARISESGWAWLVSGRRLFVWRYADQQDSSGGGGSSGFGASIISGGGWPAISGSNTPSSSFSSKSKAGSVTTKCYELLLPPSDIAHRAELICVISSIGGVGSGGGSGYHRGVSKFPAALAVSPEGAIRYWANISQESNVHDSIVSASTADLHGQECLTLVDIAPVGAILGTTTGSLVHIAFTGGSVLSESSSGGGRGVLTVSSGGAPFTCRTLKAPTGLLSGIGRRVSSFIFGSLPVTAAGVDASKQLVRIVRSSVPTADGSGDDGGDAVLLPLYFLVLTNSSLQKWIVEDNATEGLIAEIDLERHIKEAFISKLWNRSTTSHSQLTLQPMDIATVKSSSRRHSSEDEVLLLVVCTNSDSPGDRHLGLFTLADTALPSSSSISDGSFSGVLPSSSSSSSSLSAIFKSFCVFSNLELDDDQHGLNATAGAGNISFNSSITTTVSGGSNGGGSSSLLPQRRHILNILPSSSNKNGGNVDDSCYIYNSSRIYRINQLGDLDTAENGVGGGSGGRRQSVLLEEIDFQLSNDYLLGAVAPHWHHCPLLFTFKNGFLALQSSQPESIATRQLSTVDRDFVLSNDADKCTVLKRALHLFTKGEKTRALLIVQELFPWINAAAADVRPPANSAELDDVVCALSADILDQVPTTDPRWAHMATGTNDHSSTANSFGDQQGISSSTPASINYVIIANQLEDKLATHRALVSLLQAAGAWSALGSLTTAASAPGQLQLLPTKLLLLEHAEKLVVALSLRRAHLKYGGILEAAIALVLAGRRRRAKEEGGRGGGSSSTSTSFLDDDQSHLTAQDLFYREVSRIEELFWALVELEREQALYGSGAGVGGQKNAANNSSSSQHSATALVLSVTDLFTAAFADVCLYRAANGATYAAAALATADYVPWASAEHVAGVRETLHAQFELLLKVAAVDRFVQHSYMPEMMEGSDGSGGGKYGLLATKMVELADILLDSYASQLAAIDGCGEVAEEDDDDEDGGMEGGQVSTEEKVVALRAAFARTRTACLTPLLRLKQYERAASLAEKYEDFEVLIRICEELGNEEQLQAYAARFAAKGFSERLFEWYLREGKQGRMLAGSGIVGRGGGGDATATTTTTSPTSQRLSEFLSKHESLNWLHQIHLGAYREAATTLSKLATVEEQLPARRKTLLSLGKLCLIASGSTGSTLSTPENYGHFDERLKLLQLQEGLSEAVLRRKGLHRETLQVLTPEQLVEVLTYSEGVNEGGDLGPNEEVANFVAALEVTDLLARQSSQATVQTAAQLVLKIWRRAFLKDDWASYNTDQFEAPIRQSFFYQLASIYFGDQPKKLPPMSSLAAEHFSTVTNDERASFFLRATYELIMTRSS